jgi:hypothetical protein
VTECVRAPPPRAGPASCGATGIQHVFRELLIISASMNGRLQFGAKSDAHYYLSFLAHNLKFCSLVVIYMCVAQECLYSIFTRNCTSLFEQFDSHRHQTNIFTLPPFYYCIFKKKTLTSQKFQSFAKSHYHTSFLYPKYCKH